MTETFSGARLVVNTQTPLLRFVEGHPKLTTGGVVRMLVPLLHRWQASGRVLAAEWVAMGSDDAPARMTHDGLELAFVPVAEEDRAGYAIVKERMWELLNSNPLSEAPYGQGGAPESAWVSYDRYQEASAAELAQAGQRMGGLDLLYIHDFQQLGVASAWRGPRAPKVFHLHTPFPSVLPSGWAEYFVAHLRKYDAVIVSTARYADNLRAAGLDARVHVIHPFIDPSAYPFATRAATQAFRDAHEVSPDDRVILNVGRMDPMKGQDRLIDAMPAVLRDEPRARLILVGNGSFSSSKRGGLGLDKGKTWRGQLEARAIERGVAERVTFTGHLPDDQLPAAYEASEVFVLPSTREGFGLAAIEAWRHRRPIVVSERAGVAELVEPGVNGHAIDCADPELLARTILGVLHDPHAGSLGEAGYRTSDRATIDVGQRATERVFTSVLEDRAYALA